MSHCLQDLLDHHGIRYFRAREFASPRVKGGPRVDEAPREKWLRIVPTARLIDEIRHRYGKPLRLGAFRTDDYNKLVGGGVDSEHPKFGAGDLFPIDPQPGDAELLKKVSKKVVEEAHAAGMRTGLGIYRTFVHVDTGALPPKGRRRRWYGT